MTSKVFLLMIAIPLMALFTKLGWDEYQQTRAAAQVAHVQAIFREIRQIPGAEAVGGTSISVNEYSTALWRRYKANIKCLEFRPHFDSEALRQGFDFSKEYPSHGGLAVEYRNTEFEIRVLCSPADDGYSFSVNWSGLDR
ncbi:MAG: hypothetical protein H7070_05925 [Saprospiraceae bacterium]|nr:hypothetical protein [Pyrinomonadaceae bacterium]